MSTANFAHKPANLTSVACADDEDVGTYVIAATRTLTPEQYDAWTANLYQPLASYFRMGFQGGWQRGSHKVMAVKAAGRRTLLVDPSGFDYARYVAFKG
jgi:hypothetical protein